MQSWSGSSSDTSAWTPTDCGSHPNPTWCSADASTASSVESSKEAGNVIPHLGGHHINKTGSVFQFCVFCNRRVQNFEPKKEKLWGFNFQTE
jgi:hypothetical protein